MEQLYGKALELLVSPRVRQAFDLKREPPARRDRYGHTKLGQRCLLAHRLLEAGARFVMVDYGYDWGEYNNLWTTTVPRSNQPHISKMAKLPYHLRPSTRPSPPCSTTCTPAAGCAERWSST